MMNKKIIIAVAIFLLTIPFVFGACREKDNMSGNTTTTKAATTAAKTTEKANDSMTPGTNIPDTTVKGAVEEGADRIESGLDDAGDRIESGIDDAGNAGNAGNGNNADAR